MLVSQSLVCELASRSVLVLSVNAFTRFYIVSLSIVNSAERSYSVTDIAVLSVWI